MHQHSLRLAAAAAALLAGLGCGGSGGGSPEDPPATLGFGYVLEDAAQDIAAYALDDAGGLAALPGSPYALGTVTSELFLGPDRRFAYLTRQDGAILAFRIDAVTGALTALPGSPFASRAEDVVMGAAVFDATGRLLYRVNRLGDSVSAFAVDPETGALAELAGSPFAVADQPSSIQLHPSGKFAYVAVDRRVAVLAVGATGALTSVGETPELGNFPNPTLDALGGTLYVATANGEVRVFTVDPHAGTLAELSGSRQRLGDWCFSVHLDPSGKFAYAFCTTTSDEGLLAAYRIGATGALTSAGAPLSIGSNPSGVVFHPSGKALYVTDPSNRRLRAFAIAPATGALTELPAMGLPTDFSSAVAVEPSGRFAYGCNGDRTFSVYAIDASTGALTEVDPGHRLKGAAAGGAMTVVGKAP